MVCFAEESYSFCLHSQCKFQSKVMFNLYKMCTRPKIYKTTPLDTYISNVNVNYTYNSLKGFSKYD